MTSTECTPSDGWPRFAYVARSFTVLGSKMVMSASTPFCKRPLRAITGNDFSMRFAGSTVILRSASINESVCLPAKDGAPKIVDRCTLPLTGLRVVDTIITELAVIRVAPAGLRLDELAPGVTAAEVQRQTIPELIIPRTITQMLS